MVIDEPCRRVMSKKKKWRKRKLRNKLQLSLCACAYVFTSMEEWKHWRLLAWWTHTLSPHITSAECIEHVLMKVNKSTDTYTCCNRSYTLILSPYPCPFFFSITHFRILITGFDWSDSGIKKKKKDERKKKSSLNFYTPIVRKRKTQWPKKRKKKKTPSPFWQHDEVHAAKMVEVKSEPDNE